MLVRRQAQAQAQLQSLRLPQHAQPHAMAFPHAAAYGGAYDPAAAAAPAWHHGQHYAERAHPHNPDLLRGLHLLSTGAVRAAWTGARLASVAA